jgi:hypothetical protein
VKVIKPVLEELDDLNEGITELEFVEATERLYDILDPYSRATLLKTFRTKP